jgi:hypothetical protein
MPEESFTIGQKCFISNEVNDYFKDGIRKSVCDDLQVSYHSDGNSYCILHYPSFSKTSDFNQTLQRLIENKHCDFSYVWFPTGIFFNEVTFEKTVSFHHAIFNGSVRFDKSIFEKEVGFAFAKFNNFAGFSDSVFQEGCNFYRATFRDNAVFLKAQFNRKAQFREIKFEADVNFSHCVFNKEINFYSSEFYNDAIFNVSTFNDESNFSYVTFAKKAYFISIIAQEGSDISFNRTIFKGETKFNSAIIKGYVSFSGGDKATISENNDLVYRFTTLFEGNEASLDLESIRFDDTDKISFHTARLCPSWFVNTDSRKFTFINILWENIEETRTGINNELAKFKHKPHIFEKLSNPKTLLKITCRQLSENAENNNRLEEASNFRQMAFELERFERKEKQDLWWNELIACKKIPARFGEKLRIAPFDFLHFLYRWLSGYGEKWFRALCWLIAIWVIWSFVYWTPLCNFTNKTEYGFFYWFGYSLNVITLQRPEPKPTDTFTMIILGFEVLLAPLQAALLALAIRRRFMR